MSLIELKDIHKKYSMGTENEYEALKGVDVTIEKGEFVAIMGPSGSGKSTLMHIIGLLDVPTSGTYILNSKNVSKQSDEELAHIRNREVGFVFQAFNLLPRMSVYDNIVLPYTYYEDKISQQEIKKRAQEAIKLVGLVNREHNKSNQLSGGQIQRTAIARCLVMKPSIILADEPTGNLDSTTSHEIMNTLTKINQEGNTVILVTHEDDIAAYAKRIIYIRDGLVQKGPAAASKGGMQQDADKEPAKDEAQNAAQNAPQDAAQNAAISAKNNQTSNPSSVLEAVKSNGSIKTRKEQA